MNASRFAGRMALTFAWLGLCLAAAMGCNSANTPLITAAKGGDVDAVKAILDNGAPADTGFHLGGKRTAAGTPVDINAKGRYDYTALHWAAYHGYTPIAKMLVDHGADVEAREYTQSTPLLLASNQGYVEVVNILLAKGADPNPQDKDGWTPLMYAAYNGYLEIVQALVADNADTRYADKSGKTALALARDKGREPVVQFLSGAELGNEAAPPARRPLPGSSLAAKGTGAGNANDNANQKHPPTTAPSDDAFTQPKKVNAVPGE